jgi:hypothetical protein
MRLAAPPRVYADTSVISGVFDAKFGDASMSFFTQVRKRRFELVTSAIVEAEIERAPIPVRDYYSALQPFLSLIETTAVARRLLAAYLDAGIVTPRSRADALHVALATVGGCALLVSWNFRHIVNYRRVALYNAVNVNRGYTALGIHTPLEVIGDGP